jgi:hypothetical protein
MFGIAVFFWRIWLRSRQEALALGAMFVALLTYPVVQFSIRHVFHLEFIWVFAMLSLLGLPFTFRAMAFSGRGYPGVLVGITVLGLSSWVLLIQYQQRVLVSEFTQLLSKPRELVAAADGVEAPLQLDVPVPAEYDSLIASPPDSMTPAIASVGLQWDVRSAADRLVLTAIGRGCSGETTVSLNYTKQKETWQPFDQQMNAVLNGSGEGTRILFPAFYRPTQYLSSVGVANLPRYCNVRLERIRGTTVFPSFLTAILSPDWASKPLHAGFGVF